MQDLTVLAVFGIRPDAMELAPVLRELCRRAGRSGAGPHPEVTVKVCVSAQHRQMLDQVLILGDGRAAERIVSALLGEEFKAFSG